MTPVHKLLDLLALAVMLVASSAAVAWLVQGLALRQVARRTGRTTPN